MRKTSNNFDLNDFLYANVLVSNLSMVYNWLQ